MLMLHARSLFFPKKGAGGQGNGARAMLMLYTRSLFSRKKGQRGQGHGARAIVFR